jgi:hypothetical protein
VSSGLLTILLIGIICLIAAAVGGGLKMSDVEFPVLTSTPRQILLALVGASAIVLSLVLYSESRPSGPPVALPPPTTLDTPESQTATSRNDDTSAIQASETRTTESRSFPNVLVENKAMTVNPPVCRTKGIDLDNLQEGNAPNDAELIMADDSCMRGSGQAYLSALANVPLTHISSRPGSIPTLEECKQGLSSNRSDDIQGMSANGGTLCFLTTMNKIAGVALTSTRDQVVTLHVTLWYAD